MGSQGKLPFGQVPVLQLDGETFAQTQARFAQDSLYSGTVNRGRESTSGSISLKSKDYETSSSLEDLFEAHESGFPSTARPFFAGPGVRPIFIQRTLDCNFVAMP